jgi:hypothetical protein
MPNSDRRDEIAGLAAPRASTLHPTSSATQPRAPSARVIDSHCHFVSPSLLKALTAREGRTTEGLASFFPLSPWKDYSPAKDIEAIDRDGVATKQMQGLSACRVHGEEPGAFRMDNSHRLFPRFKPEARKA